MEQILELRDNEDKQYRGNHYCNDYNGRRINQSLLDLGLEELCLFLHRGDTVINFLQGTRLLAGRHKVTVQRIKILRKAPKGLRKRNTARDFCAYSAEQVPHLVLIGASREELECLNDRNARAKHGADLTRQHGYIHGIYAGAQKILRSRFAVYNSNTLLLQLNCSKLYRLGLNLSVNDSALLVLAFPFIRSVKLLDLASLRGGGVLFSRYAACGY